MNDGIESLLRSNRHREAFERLLDLYGTKVLRMAVMYLKNRGRAEEITQDIFLKMWKVLPSYDGRAAPSTWLYTIARNTCLSAIRSETLRYTVPLDTVAEPLSPDTADDDTEATRLALARSVACLPEVQREVITLFYLQEKSIKDVAAMLDMPEGTVKSHLHRARIALAAMIRKVTI